MMVPFDDSDGSKLLGRVVQTKNKNALIMGTINLIDHSTRRGKTSDRCVIIGDSMAETYDTLYKLYEFEDGSPCGKESS